MEKIGNKLVNFASILEPKTRGQAAETAKMPFIYPHMALMPDAHLGIGATVGSVIPTLGAIMPAAVGVDIGCGMMAVRSQWTKAEVDEVVGKRQKFGMSYPDQALRDLHKRISSLVPLSAGAANGKILKSAEPKIESMELLPGIEQAEQEMPTWRFQLGTLGSGNHFIEISTDEQDRVWLFLHSGSRGVGNRLATKHIKVAKKVCDGLKLPNQDLAYLTEGTSEFASYMEALHWAQMFAFRNRHEMMDRVMLAMGELMGASIKTEELIQCHHNYTEPFKIGDVSVWLSRKGAIDAREGVSGLIPGSMGDKSYVVTGKGNADALWSAPHGAGRNYSRSAAKKQFTRQDLDSRMKGVVWGESDAFLDEHPQAYKPIDQIMEDAADLVEIRHSLRQFVNVKGN